MKFGDANYDPARCPEMKIELVQLADGASQAHASVNHFELGDPKIPYLGGENLFQSGSRDHENVMRIFRSHPAQRIIPSIGKVIFPVSASHGRG